MSKNSPKNACEYWSSSDYKERAEIAHQKDLCVATSIMRKAVIETFEMAFGIAEEKMKQKAIEAFHQCCNHRANECNNNCITCGAYKAFVKKINE